MVLLLIGTDVVWLVGKEKRSWLLKQEPLKIWDTLLMPVSVA